MSIARITRAAAVSGLLICAAPVSVVTAPPAAAHTGLTGSAPDDGATVAASPARVSLSFNDPMDARYSRVAVTGASGRSVTTGAPKVDGRTVSQALTAELPAGRYTVGYRVVSADGHPVSGSYSFTVAAAGTTAPVPRPSRSRPASAAPSASAEADDADQSSGPGALPVAAGAAAVLAGAGGITYAVRKRGFRHGN
ncbi:copper resistance CopC family protein [Streptomyces sp. NPDC097640]|uniref:copper resistance CopC family protein n=1 Tax=Streptomyces sp. NPDC097640 TaxID=3157229 RepID=UPI003316D859